MEIIRRQRIQEITDALARSPICLILGPRQAGKTHLARHFQTQADNYFDLENLVDERRLQENPQGELSRLYGLVVIDEAQRMPKLFPILRFLADRPDNPARFLLTGSASPELMEEASESLAGRVAYVDVGGFDVEEIEPPYHETLWLQGGLPRAYLQNEADSFNWRIDYLRSLVGEDLRELAQIRIAPVALRRLLQHLAQTNGRVWNHSAAARLLDVEYKTVQRYVDLLAGTFLLRLLLPFDVNLAKRLRKSPKLYFRDSGLVHALLNIRSQRELRGHLDYGFSWEGFALEQVIRVLRLRDSECFSHAVHSGAEMDLVVERGGHRYGFEFKASESPGNTDSIREVIGDLNLTRVFIVHPGDRDYAINEQVQAVAARNLPALRGRWEAQ
jgi:predicted AAA+ superfamily ATPase